MASRAETIGLPAASRHAALGLAVSLLALAWCAPAAAHVVGLPQSGHIYWADQTGNNIGRANLDGTGVNPSFITGATAPRAVAVGGAQLYWAQGDTPGSIGRANLDGSGVNHSFVSTGSSPQGVAVDRAGVYYAHTVSGAGKIGRARPDGSSPNPSFLSTAASPCGVAVDPDKVYWGNGGNPGTIGRAHGPMSVTQGFVTGAQDPCSVAVTDTNVYWANRAGNAIGRVNLDGSGVNQSFMPVSSPCGVAADGVHVYWTTASGTIGRAHLDGSNVEESFITGVPGACGVAVEPTLRPTPAGYAFPDTRVRGQGPIKAFFLANTSSSTLAVSRILVIGANARDFVKTADSCVLNVTAAGGGCVFNIRFRPRGAGTRRALLRVTSNASSSPTDLPISGRADARAPRLLRAAVLQGTFEVDRRGRSERPRGSVRKGTTFRYSLNERARVSFTIAKMSRGSRVRGRCVRSRRANRKRPRCTRFKRVGRFVHPSRAGRNRKRFSGKIGQRQLRPGRYRARLTATDATGNTSGPRLLRFRVVR